MAVNEYPGKADHYRMCLSVIADAPGEERPGLKQFLQTGSRGKLRATYSIGHVSKVTTQNPMYPLEKIFLQDCKTLGECIKMVKRHNKILNKLAQEHLLPQFHITILVHN